MGGDAVGPGGFHRPLRLRRMG